MLEAGKGNKTSTSAYETVLAQSLDKDDVYLSTCMSVVSLMLVKMRKNYLVAKFSRICHQS